MTQKPKVSTTDSTTSSSSPVVHIARFKNGLFDTKPTEGKVPWADLYHHLTDKPAPAENTQAAKRKLPAFSFAEYGVTKERADQNVLQLHGLVYDIDNKPDKVPFDITPELLNLKPFAHLYHSSFQSTPEQPRWRLVIPLARPIPRAQYQALYQIVAGRLGIVNWYDTSCSNPSRLFFEFHTPHPEHAFSGGVLDAPFLDPADFTPQPVKETKSEAASPATTPAGGLTDEENASALLNLVSEHDQKSPEEVWNLLKYIDPDEGEDLWKRTILALQQHFIGSHRSDIGLEIAHRWSEQSAVYDEKEIEGMWARPLPAKPVTLGSLIDFAKKRGYEPPAPVDWGNYKFHPIGPLYLATNLPEPNWLVRGLINRDALTMLSGQGGIGKSMLLMQMSVSLASGTDFLGYKVERPHRVIYLNAEDSQMKFARRLTTYRDLTGIPAEPLIHNLHYYGAEQTFTRLTGAKGVNKKGLDELVHSIKAAQSADPELPTVVIFDPFIQFISGNENANDEMNHGIVAFRALQARTKSTVLFGHHEAKRKPGEPQTGNGHSGRGASAIYDGARQAFKMRWQDDEEIESLLGITSSDVTREEKSRFVALEHTKADEGEITGDILLRRSMGGALVKAEKLTLEERRELAERMILDVDVSPEEVEAREAFVDRYRALLVRKAAPTPTQLRRNGASREELMGAEWATREKAESWINYGVAIGKLRRSEAGRMFAGMMS